MEMEVSITHWPPIGNPAPPDAAAAIICCCPLGKCCIFSDGTRLSSPSRDCGTQPTGGIQQPGGGPPTMEKSLGRIAKISSKKLFTAITLN